MTVLSIVALVVVVAALGWTALSIAALEILHEGDARVPSGDVAIRAAQRALASAHRTPASPARWR